MSALDDIVRNCYDWSHPELEFDMEKLQKQAAEELAQLQARVVELELLILKNLSPNDCYQEYSPVVQEIKDRLGDK